MYTYIMGPMRRKEHLQVSMPRRVADPGVKITSVKRTKYWYVEDRFLEFRIRGPSVLPLPLRSIPANLVLPIVVVVAVGSSSRKYKCARNGRTRRWGRLCRHRVSSRQQSPCPSRPTDSSFARCADRQRRRANNIDEKTCRFVGQKRNPVQK